MFAHHANITAIKRATMRSIVKPKNTGKYIIRQSLFATHANITATKRATMCSIVKPKNISKHQKMMVSRQPK
jgi:hypothetical protein